MMLYRPIVWESYTNFIQIETLSTGRIGDCKTVLCIDNEGLLLAIIYYFQYTAIPAQSSILEPQDTSLSWRLPIQAILFHSPLTRYLNPCLLNLFISMTHGQGLVHDCTLDVWRLDCLLGLVLPLPIVRKCTHLRDPRLGPPRAVIINK